jgi:dynein heavy chain
MGKFLSFHEKVQYRVIILVLSRRRRGVYVPSMGKQCVLFVDDLSMPQKEIYGSQPPVELLRQWIDHGHWFDLKDKSKLELVDVVSTVNLWF